MWVRTREAEVGTDAGPGSAADALAAIKGLIG